MNTVIKKVGILFSAVGLQISCQTKPPVEIEPDYPTLTIHWSQDSVGNLADLVSHTDYVLLDNRPEAIFSEATKIVSLDSLYYIFDKYGTNKLLVFNSGGQYQRQIGRPGQGPGEYLSLEDFTIKNDTIHLLDFNSKKISLYSIAGDFLQDRTLPFLSPAGCAWLNQGFLFYDALYQDEPANDRTAIFATDDQWNITHRSLSYSSASPRVSYDPAFIEIDTTILFARYLNDSIFLFNRQGGINSVIHFDFGEYRVPESIKSNAKEMERNNDNYIYLTSSPVIAGHYLIGMISDRGNKNVYAIDIQTGRLHLNLTTQAIRILPQNLAVKDSKTVVSWISLDTETFCNRNPEKSPIKLPQEMSKKVENGDCLLVLYNLE